MQRRCFETLFISAVLLMVAATPASARDIYVTENAEGNPVYSDRPSGGDATAIELRQSNTYDPQPIPEVQPSPERRRDGDSSAVRYQVRITQPAHEETIRAPEGNVRVEVSVEPAPRTGHRLQLLRNGSPVPGAGGSFNVQTYDRGANEFVARVMEGDRELARSEPVTVFLLRRGLLSPAPANPAPNFPVGAP